MSILRSLGLVLLVALAVAGCGGGREAGRAVQPPPSDAKILLEKIASTGQLSANEAQLENELLGLAESRPEMAEELRTDFEQLSSLSDPAAIKAKAGEMAAKL